MSVFHNNALIGAGGGVAASVDANITKSLRFNDADSAYLGKTFSSAGNRRTWTFSAWVKRVELGTTDDIFNAGGNASQPRTEMRFKADDTFTIGFNPTASTWYNCTTTAVFRDPSAWYHIVVECDTTQATDTNRLKLYINGVLQTFGSTSFVAQNTQLPINDSTYPHAIGRYESGGSAYFHGYMADIYFIDGSALDPTSFGAYDDNGVWQAAAYSGTFGTNGFHLLDFANESTVGHDSSGNNNDFTANNISTTAGAGNDVLFDVPTNGTQSDSGAGGEVSGNYPTFNPLLNPVNTLSNGNLDATAAGNNRVSLATFGIPASGKWYFEITDVDSSSGAFIGGVGAEDVSITNYLGTSSSGWGYQTHASTPVYWNNNSSTSTGVITGHGSNTVLGVAVDRDAGKIWFSIDGTFVNSGAPASGTNAQFTNLPSTGVLFPGASCATGKKFILNAGQRAFAYSAPSGYKAINTASYPTPTIADGSDYFEATTYSGNDGTQTITGINHSPDLVWIKVRNETNSHYLFDTVRGADQALFSDSTSAETDYTAASPAGRMTAFTSDGFTVKYSNSSGTNASGDNYIAWTWDAGSSTASNTDGSITTSVRASATSGFSIVTYTGNGTDNATFGHGLNAVPELIIVKRRDSADDWFVYSLPTANNILKLNDTDAKSSSSHFRTMSSSTFQLSGNADVNANNGTFVAYCISPVAGYSAVGSYSGNGSSTVGPFISTGFRVNYLLVKNVDSAAHWFIFDAVRDPENTNGKILRASDTTTEFDGGTEYIDFLSNGFKLRTNIDQFNKSGDTYIYLAIAENPFQANGGLAR
jgi:hypothetical protein